MKKIIYLLGCILFSACASIYVSDLSTDTRFSKYIGHEFALKSNALICKDGYLGNASSAAPKGNELILKETEQTCHTRKPIAKVIKGTIIRIDNVLMSHNFPPMWRHIYFIGRVELSNNSEENFYYFYGFDSDVVPGELPWQTR